MPNIDTITPHDKPFVRKIEIIREIDDLIDPNDYANPEDYENQTAYYVYAQTTIYYPIVPQGSYQLIPIKSGGIGGVFGDFKLYELEEIEQLKDILQTFGVDMSELETEQKK